MTKKFSKTVLVFVLVLYFLYVVLANAPARLLASLVHENIPTVWLNSVEGTVWRGSAAAAQIDVRPYALPLGKLTWELSPMSVLTLNPCVQFQASQPGQNLAGELCHSVGGTSTVNNLTVDGSMALINSLVGTELTGQASLEVQRGEFKDNRVEKLSAQLTWHNARAFVIDEWLSLGNFGARANENGEGGVAADIFTIESPTELDLQAVWLGPQGWQLDGTVVPNDGTPEKIAEGLKLFGEEVEPGKYKVVWR